MAEGLSTDSTSAVRDLSSDLFTIKPFDGRYQESKYITSYPASPLTPSSDQYLFQLGPLSGKAGYRTDTILILMDLQIQTKMGNPPDKNIVCAPVANTLHSMFDKVSVMVMNRDCNETNDFYATRAYLQTIMNMKEEDELDRGFCQGMQRDTIYKFDDIKNVPNTPDAFINKGFGKRRKHYHFYDENPDAPNANPPYRNQTQFYQRAFTLIGPLYHELMHNDRPIPWNTAMQIKLNKSKRAFLFMCSDEDSRKDFEMVITRLELKIQVAVFTEKLILRYERMFADNKKAIFYYRRFHVVSKLIP